NAEHRHSGIGLLTAHDVHYGLADQRIAARAGVLTAAYAAHPERFVAGVPRPPARPTEVWINPPPATATSTSNPASAGSEKDGGGATLHSETHCLTFVDRLRAVISAATALRCEGHPRSAPGVGGRSRFGTHPPSPRGACRPANARRRAPDSERACRSSSSARR